ncbi:MAG: hypothetical protein HN350_20995 [Phycisphaerales bacterium]|nr:hypothetical protein [Phycisphaerales bacterium]
MKPLNSILDVTLADAIHNIMNQSTSSADNPKHEQCVTAFVTRPCFYSFMEAFDMESLQQTDPTSHLRLCRCHAYLGADESHLMETQM